MSKKIIKIIILFIIFISSGINTSFAKSGYVKYDENIYGYEFNEGDDINFFMQANKNYRKFENSKSNEDKKFYLHEAQHYYFMLEQMDSKSIDAQIGLARVYDAMNMDKFAKEHFYKANNINSQNPELNFAFGNFYFRRKDYIMALRYYNLAYEEHYGNDFLLNLKMAVIYEKLGDLEKSRQFYNKANAISHSSNKFIKEKINSIKKLDYSNSQYYMFLK